VFPVAEQLRESSVPSGFGREQAKSDAKCVRSAAMDLGHLVERVLFIGVETNCGRRHDVSVARLCYAWSRCRTVAAGLGAGPIAG